MGTDSLDAEGIGILLSALGVKIQVASHDPAGEFCDLASAEAEPCLLQVVFGASGCSLNAAFNAMHSLSRLLMASSASDEVPPLDSQSRSARSTDSFAGCVPRYLSE